MEIGVIQNKNPEALTEPLLAEIDDMFQEAESYFRNKQELLHQRQITFKQQRGAMGQARSKIDTNLTGARAAGDNQYARAREDDQELFEIGEANNNSSI